MRDHDNVQPDLGGASYFNVNKIIENFETIYRRQFRRLLLPHIAKATLAVAHLKSGKPAHRRYFFV
ncbi:MAG: hypothetical protein KGJ59_05120 [Bacteroidota bacterium]|nr:hypothetical protein [Bacteroidota bacterium]